MVSDTQTHPYPLSRGESTIPVSGKWEAKKILIPNPHPCPPPEADCKLQYSTTNIV
jgi:hypothetical protein